MQGIRRMEDQVNQGTKFRDWLNMDRAQLLDHDLSSTIKKKLESTPSPSSVSYQKRLDGRSKNSNEELIKYMSNLPGYLEKGDNLREKALSFGVLDWQRLEKWQHNHKQTFNPSTSNDSLYSSTDLSSTRSSQDRSCSPDVTAVKQADKFQDFKEKSDKLAKGERSIYRKHESFSKGRDIKPKEHEREDIGIQSVPKMKTRNGKSSRQVEELENLVGVNRNSYEGKHIAPSDDFEINHRGGKLLSSNIKLSPESFESPSHSLKFPISPSRSKNLEDRPTKLLDRSQPKIGIVENHKLRSTSPNSMLSFGLNRLSRRSNSLDLSFEPVLSKSEPKKDIEYSGLEITKSRNPSPNRRFNIGLNRFGRRSSSLDFSSVPRMSSEHDPYISQSKKDMGFCLENSSNDKPKFGRKSEMSPLRRLLDPLLKPKAVNSYSSEKDSEKLHLQRSEPINGKNVPSTVQALMQMSIKNGLPLLTFADDKNSGVLAATMKKVTSLKKGDNGWIYTFFNVDEVKKKNGWINKRCKGKTHGFVPSVIAQMRVSDIRHNPVIKFSTREFVSFSLEVSENDQQTSNFRQKDELAAILVKFPNEAPSCRDEVKRGSDCINDPPFAITAILPGGSHGLPSKGKPSPLIERWKSGGVCDCGGWDLGCRLTVLTSQAEFGRRSNFSNTYQAEDSVELFPQGEVINDRPVFVLSPFKDNIYSVEFDSSLSFLQAFSICISILNCRKPYNLSELSKLFEGKTEDTLMAGEMVKAPNPPLSPVGRV